jgi:hypothetical protein
MKNKRKCRCGSGQIETPQYDGHGIFLCYVCPRCRARRMAGYRPDIMERYWPEEAIEED